MNNFLTFKHLCFVAWFACAPFKPFCQPATEPATETKRALFDLFKPGETPKLTLMANFDSIKANIRNKSYVSGIFEVEHSRKNSTKLEVKLRPRGKSRRMMCDFPPLKLKFDKSNLDSNGLEKFNDFKLVTHCLDDDAISDVNIKREYLIYQLFNQLTPYSFKASLVKITYKNTGISFNKSTHLGIIIEDAECLAHRSKGKVMGLQVIALDSMESNREKIASVFQYMIGNADWSYAMARNTQMIQQEDGYIIPVPYDFDYAGLVKAPYARANAALGQKTVLDRVYLGNASTLEELTSTFSYFKTKKPDLIKTIDDFYELDEAIRLEMIAYIAGFYELIEDNDRVNKEMLARVKKN